MKTELPEVEPATSRLRVVKSDHYISVSRMIQKVHEYIAWSARSNLSDTDDEGRHHHWRLLSVTGQPTFRIFRMFVSEVARIVRM